MSNNYSEDEEENEFRPSPFQVITIGSIYLLILVVIVVVVGFTKW